MKSIDIQIYGNKVEWVDPVDSSKNVYIIPLWGALSEEEKNKLPDDILDIVNDLKSDGIER